jgi:hypothetical protein
MTYDEFEAISDDLVIAVRDKKITQTQFEDEMEALQEQWEEEGEE